MAMLLNNSVKCLSCNTVVRSKFRHDYVTCKCGDVSVDGGTLYSRCIFKDFNKVESLQVYDDGKHETRRVNALWGMLDKKRNGYVYKPISELTDEHIVNILNNVNDINKIYKQIFEDEIIWREQQFMTKNSLT